MLAAVIVVLGGPQALALLSGIVRVGGAVSALLSADLPWSLFSSPLDFDSITGPADFPAIRVTPTTILRDVDPNKIGHGIGDFFRKVF